MALSCWRAGDCRGKQTFKAARCPTHLSSVSLPFGQLRQVPACVQGEETFDVVPDSAFVVSRTAHRNNSSDYHINDRRSNFTEVTSLLKGKGIDLDNNRFLILQVKADCHSCACLSFARMALKPTPQSKARLSGLLKAECRRHQACYEPLVTCVT